MEIGLPGPAFSASWFLGLIVVAVVGGLAAAVGGLIVRGLDRGAQQEADQSAAIEAVRTELHQCRLREAERESRFVTREQHEARVIRIEDSIRELEVRIDDKLQQLELSVTSRIDMLAGRIHERLDAVALALGIQPGREGKK
jgi:hypothetical protein